MRAHKLPEIESKFKSNLRDASGFQWKRGTPELQLPADIYVPLAGKTNHYYQDKSAKKLIAVHSTSGILTGDIAALSNGKKVSTHFVVARDGTIYQLFPMANWAYHMGATSVGGNTAVSKTSVAIEISNIGPLKQVGDVMIDAYNKPYCGVTDTDLYVSAPYRGNAFYATYTEEQYVSLSLLLPSIAAAQKIQLSMPVEPLRFQSTLPKSTILFHQNTRSDKVDPGPAFDYSRLIPEQ